MTTLLDIRQGVLAYLNDVVDLTPAIPSRFNEQALNMIINRCMHFYERQLNSFYSGYLNDVIPISLVANTQVYALPAKFRSPIYEVRRPINDFNYYLDSFIPYNATLGSQPIPNVSWTPTYWLEDQNIHFAYPPVSDEAASAGPDGTPLTGVYIKYQKKLADLSADNSILDPQLDDAQGCIEIRAVLRALKGKDVSGALKNLQGWQTELDAEEKTFYTQAGKRYVKPFNPIPSGYNSGYDTDY